MLAHSEIASHKTGYRDDKKAWYHPWLNETQLWDAFRNGDKQAMTAIYLTYFNVLYNYGCRMFTGKEKVRDCIQDLFFELWKSRQALSSTDSVKFYLMKALRIKIGKELKRESRFLRVIRSSGDYHFDFIVPYELEIINEQVRIERKEKLSRAFERLSARQKEIIFLRFFHDLEYREIASIMSIHYQSVHNLIFRAIKVLRRNIS